jgi:hypothetical protein
MNNDLELLENIADWLRKQPEANDHDLLVQEETKRLKKVIFYHLMSLTNETQLNTYLQINLFKLVEICDMLFIPEHEGNANAASVLDLIIAIRQASLVIGTQDLLLPLVLRHSLSIEFEIFWKATKDKLKSQEIDSTLIEIISFAFQNFANSYVRPKWSNKTYLHLFCEALNELPDLATLDETVHLLIRMGYNYSRFTAYCYRWMAGKLENKTPEAKQKAIGTLKKDLRQLELITNEHFDPRKISVVDELSKWLDEEQAGEVIGPTESTVNPMKLNTNLKVLELAYWKKLQYDNGILQEVNLDILSEKVAYNFSSKFQQELSAASIKSKFYPKDRATLEPIEGILVKMLDEVRQFLR